MDNAVPITSWYDDPADRELTDLLALMDEVAAAADCRPVLSRWFRLAERVHLAAERAFNAALEARLGLLRNYYHRHVSLCRSLGFLLPANRCSRRDE